MKKALFLAAVTALLFTACKKEEEPTPMNMAPELSYSQTTFETYLHETGNTGVPVLDWNGSVGTLSLAVEEDGISLNSANGVVSWEKDLALGSTTITVVATNGEGQTSKELTFNNSFQGDFTGNYNFDPNNTSVSGSNYELNFASDGSMTVSDFGSPGEGTWTIDGTTVTGVYSYDGGNTFFTVEGEVTHNATSATYAGFWYEGATATAGNESGYFEVKLQ